MSTPPQVTPFNELPKPDLDLNLAIEQASQTSAMLDSLGIEKATFKNGAIYHNDQANNRTTLAHSGLMVERRQHTTSVTYLNEGSTQRQATEELASLPKPTQEVIGSFAGKSQPWVSQTLTDDSAKKE